MLRHPPEDASGRPGVGVSALLGRLVSLNPGGRVPVSTLYPEAALRFPPSVLTVLFARSVAHGGFRGSFNILLRDTDAS